MIYVNSADEENGVGCMLDGMVCVGVIKVRRVNSRLLLVKAIWRGLMCNQVIACSLQVGLDKATQRKFWKAFDFLHLSVSRQASDWFVTVKPRLHW